MGKIKTKLQNMSLKKALIILMMISLTIVSLLTIITILNLSNFRQEILDKRPIRISDYTIEESNDSITLIDPQEFSYEPLTKANLFYYWLFTILMVVLPVGYIVVIAILMTRLYYQLKIKEPLQSLNNGVEHILKQDLDFKIETFSNDELGRLCKAFETMRNEIYNSNRKMWDLLQERKALTASLSHDLRTPITVINGYLDYLDKASDKQMLTSNIMHTSIKQSKAALWRLEKYVDCIKDIQKFTDIEECKEVFDLKEYLDDLINDFSILADKHNRKLIVEQQLENIMIEGDKVLLSKILENVFVNALRFSKQEINFLIKKDNEKICLIIYDDGKGFSKEELKQATSFFYTTSTNKGNYGIGLAICNILCMRLGYVLTLKNTANHGALVRIEIDDKNLS